ncbi:MAG: dUTP diphosphatase [Candidatus Lokiarchaeota archaeon]|nr:dUTP diphosphatase [Candidatus Lokiarchaeota archaeon]MBD3341767.1 dUTP diphosphatase [Candidatus Lokiarchaeota archaeon]
MVNSKAKRIPLKKLVSEVAIPRPSKPGDAGADARIMGFKQISVKEGNKDLIEVETDSYNLKPLERIGCPLGFSTAIPEGYYFQVVPRSGLALWEGISILNTPGTIDSGYRNEWMAIVVNLSNKDVVLKKGDRICQIILSKVYNYVFEETSDLPQSKRGLGGFGSTGKN